MKKYQLFLSEKNPFWVVKFSIYLNRCVFKMLFFLYIYLLNLETREQALQTVKIQMRRLHCLPFSVLQLYYIRIQYGRDHHRNSGMKGLMVLFETLIHLHSTCQRYRSQYSLFTTADPKNTILKTRLYNFDPLKPPFYIVKLGFTQVYIIFFLFLLKNIDCGYLLDFVFFN